MALWRYDIDGLVYAAERGRLEDVKDHLQNGVDVNGEWFGDTPLSRAVSYKRFEVIRFLLSKGAVGDTRAAYDIDGLANAAGDGRLEDVRDHLQNGVDVNGECRGDTALYRAMRGSHSRIVKFLVSKGAKYNIRGLVEAAGAGRLEDVKEHLQNGVDVNGTYRDGDTALNIAMRHRSSQIVQILVSKGAKYDIRGLVEAARDGRLEVVKDYLQNGVDVNGQWNGVTALDRAMRHRHSQVVQFLLSKGATYNIEGLVEAAGNGQLEIVKILLQNGADVNEEWHGNTPLSSAVICKRYEIIRFLLSKGAIGDTRAARRKGR